MADSEGMFSRGWRDTRATFHDWRFWAVEVIGGGLAGIINPWFALIFIVGCVLVLYIGFTARAPVKLRQEKIQELERTLSPATVEVEVLEPPTAKHLSPGGGGKRMVTFPCVSVRATGDQPEEVSFRLYLEGWDACWVPAFEPPGLLTSPDEPPNFPRLVTLQPGKEVRQQLEFRVPFSTEGFAKMRCRLVAVKPAAEHVVETFELTPADPYSRAKNDQLTDPKLGVTLAVHGLEDSYPADSFQAMWEDRGYLILTVRNTSDTTLKDIVARCSVADQGTELPRHWSSEAGPNFVRGDVYSVDLPVDHERVLLVAMAFPKDRLWARLPSRLEYVFSSTQVTSYGDPERLSYLGEPLDLGEELELVVTFKATGLDQTERIRLGFDASGPTVERVTPPAAPLRSKSGS